MTTPSDFTRLLGAAERDEHAFHALFELVHDELVQLARAQMARERPGHTLQATALVNEAWLRLAGDARHAFGSRRHFFGAAARAMQRVLTDHARRVLAEKRGADRERLELTGLDLASGEDPVHALEVSDALETLAREDARAAEVARLRLYAGLEVAEVAAALETSERTVAREWTYARARLSQILGAAADEG